MRITKSFFSILSILLVSLLLTVTLHAQMTEVFAKEIKPNPVHDTRKRVWPYPNRKNISKVYVLEFDPVLSNGKTVSQYLHEKQGLPLYDQQITDAINFFKKASRGKLQYKVVERKTEKYWPVKIDGFQYDEKSYLSVITQQIPHHEPDFADYYQFLNDEKLDICGKLNRGEIDEVWLFGGPWFGFYESAMASHEGEPGFWVNGPTFDKTDCQKLLPVGIPGAHTFGHRMESIMTFVYGSWQQNRTDHTWDEFGLERAHSPNYSAFGCGSVHFAPNARTDADDYDFDIKEYVNSYCDSFLRSTHRLYTTTARTKRINCDAWGCTREGYELWWWQHIPRFPGRGTDTKLNNWWTYFADPNMVYPQKPGRFMKLFAQMPEDGPATFNFQYTEEGLRYKIDVSTTPDMSHDVYVNFTQSAINPAIETNPQKWDKYSCGRDLYWRITAYDGTQSPITKTTVSCTNSLHTTKHRSATR